MVKKVLLSLIMSVLVLLMNCTLCFIISIVIDFLVIDSLYIGMVVLYWLIPPIIIAFIMLKMLSFFKVNGIKTILILSFILNLIYILFYTYFESLIPTRPDDFMDFRGIIFLILAPGQVVGIIYCIVYFLKRNKHIKDQNQIKSNTQLSDWPFDEAENFAVFISTRILMDKRPILCVTHDEDDGAWQFHSGDLTGPEEALIVSFREVYDIDRTIGLLAGLPLGCFAERKSVIEPWVIGRKSV